GSDPSSAGPWRESGIYAINRDGSKHRLISDAYSTTAVLGEPSRTDPRHVHIVQYRDRNIAGYRYQNRDARPRICRVNVYVEEPSSCWGWSLDTAPFSNAQFLLDRADQVRFILGTDEQLLPAAGWKSAPQSEWQTFELAEFRRDGLEAVRLDADDGSAFLIGARHDDAFAALYRLDLSTRNVTRVLGFDNADVQQVITDFTNSRIVGVRGYAQRSVEQWLLPDDAAAKAYAALHRAFPGQRVQVTSASLDGSRAVVFVDSDVNPGDYYLFDTA